jgi:hypothetical protein
MSSTGAKSPHKTFLLRLAEGGHEVVNTYGWTEGSYTQLQTHFWQTAAQAVTSALC